MIEMDHLLFNLNHVLQVGQKHGILRPRVLNTCGAWCMVLKRLRILCAPTGTSFTEQMSHFGMYINHFCSFTKSSFPHYYWPPSCFVLR